jgi:hypothetical protein
MHVERPPSLVPLWDARVLEVPVKDLDGVYSVDGTFVADGDVFAKFVDETLLWHCYPTETHWPVLVVKAPRP